VKRAKIPNPNQVKRAKIPNPNQVKRAKIPNFLVVALDEATASGPLHPNPNPYPNPNPEPSPNANPHQARFLKGRNTAHYLRKLRSASG